MSAPATGTIGRRLLRDNYGWSSNGADVHSSAPTGASALRLDLARRRRHAIFRGSRHASIPVGGLSMRMITGAILLLAGEQAFAHAYLVGFPNAPLAQDVLVPASGVLGATGLAFLIWGLMTEGKDS